LNKESVFSAADGGVVLHSVFPNVVAVGASHVVQRTTRKALTPVEVKPAVGIIVGNIIGDPVQRITALESMLLTTNPRDIAGIEVDVVTRRDIPQYLEGVADVLQASGPGKWGRHRRTYIAAA